MTATGFLPGHPVHLAVDGKPIATVTADANGDIGYQFDPAPGRHLLTAQSMVLDQQVSFTK